MYPRVVYIAQKSLLVNRKYKCLAGLAILAWYVLYKIANDEALKYELLEQSKTFRFRTYKHKETQLSIEYFLRKYDRFVYL